MRRVPAPGPQGARAKAPHPVRHRARRAAAGGRDRPTVWIIPRIWLPGTDEAANYEYDIPRQSTPQPSVKIRKRDRGRAERIAAAGGPKPSLRERAVALVEKLGEARTRDLTAIGIPPFYLARMCEEGLLVKVGYGRYRTAGRRAA